MSIRQDNNQRNDARSWQGMAGVGLNTKCVPEPWAYSVKETTRILGIGARKLFDMTKRGEIPHIKLGKRVLYPVAQLRAWLEAQTKKGGAL